MVTTNQKSTTDTSTGKKKECKRLVIGLQKRTKQEEKKNTTKQVQNFKKMAIRTFILIITLNINKLNFQQKHIGCLNA